jgi:two-component system sensor histidine kinase and response regulator WspE
MDPPKRTDQTAPTQGFELLARQGYLVVQATDGVDAWSKVRENACDLVITDVDMPRMDGIALTRSVKQDPRLRSTPVMIVSYRDSEEDRARGLAAAADFYFAKSEFEGDALLQAVVNLIGEAKA